MKTIPFEGELTEQQKLNIKEWVEALRSGKYKQITGKLGTPEGNCCLGVCSELDPVVIVTNNKGFNLYQYKNSSHFELPDDNWMQKRFGFDSDELVARENTGGGYRLYDLNDKGYAFDAIANVIEACFLKREEIEL